MLLAPGGRFPLRVSKPTTFALAQLNIEINKNLTLLICVLCKWPFFRSEINENMRALVAIKRSEIE
jgi:hypothetical protein